MQFMAPLKPAAEGTERSFCLRDLFYVLTFRVAFDCNCRADGGCAWFPCYNLSSIRACASNLGAKLNVFPTLSSV